MGRPLPGCAVALVDPLTGAPGAEGEICLDLSHRPLGLMTGYQGAGGRAGRRTGIARPHRVLGGRLPRPQGLMGRRAGLILSSLAGRAVLVDHGAKKEYCLAA
jgi:hypothetical protein